MQKRRLESPFSNESLSYFLVKDYFCSLFQSFDLSDTFDCIFTSFYHMIKTGNYAIYEGTSKSRETLAQRVFISEIFRFT